MGASTRRTIAVAIAALLGLVACTGIPRQRDDAELQKYLDYAGKPVDQITYLGHYQGWNAVGRYQLVV